MSENPLEMRLALIILDESELLDDVLMGLVDLGVTGATVVDSRGMGQIIRQDVQIFTGLANLFPETSRSVLIFSVMKASLVSSVFDMVDEVVGQIDRPNSAVCFSLPVDQTRGIKL